MKKSKSIIIRLGVIFGLATLILVAVLLAVLARQLLIKSSESAKEQTYSKALQIKDEMEARFDEIYITAKKYAGIIEATQYATEPLSLEYTDFSQLVRTLIGDYEDIYNLKLILEPGIFYAADSSLALQDGFDAHLRYAFQLQKDPMGRILQKQLSGFDNDGVGDYYLWPRKYLKSYITPPATVISEHDDFLSTHITVPLMVNNKFAGVLAVQISLDWLQTLAEEKAIKQKDATISVYSQQGVILARSFQPYSRGDNLGQLYPDKVRRLLQIKSGEKHINEYPEFMEFALPLNLLNNQISWQLTISVSRDELAGDTRNLIRNLIVILILVMIVVTVVIYYLTRKLMRPLDSLHQNAKRIARGNIKVEKLDLELNEIGLLNQELNDIVDGLNRMASFANEIKQGNLNADYKPLSKNDVLGTALLEMKDSLREAAQREQERKLEDNKRTWITEGLARFSNILRQNNDDIDKLAYSVTREMVDYVEALQGAVFVYNDSPQNPSLELLVAYAYNQRKHLKRSVPFGDGLVGACAKEKAPIVLTEIPDEYMLISSGLGQTAPRSILLMPMIVNDQIFGVIELAALKPFEQYKVNFVEQLAENIASTLASVKINQRTNHLLKKTQEQALEMKKQEAEMRQNLEELRATQERFANRDAETNSILKVLDEAAMVAQFSLDGRLIKANQNFADFFAVKISAALGRDSKEFADISPKHVEKYQSFWDEVKAGKTQTIEQFVRIADQIKWYKAVFAAINNSDGAPIKIIAVAYDISRLKQLEKEIKRSSAGEKKDIVAKYEEQIAQLNRKVAELQRKVINPNDDDLWE